MRPSDDPAWREYPNTVLRFREAGFAIDLRRPLDDRALALVAGLGLREPWCVVTAANPRGQPTSDVENGARLAALADAIDRLACGPRHRCDGGDPFDRHSEPGFAFPADVETARAIARRFEQSAFFACLRGRCWIEGALVETLPIPLPLATSPDRPLP
jgi:hypothetical protein